MLDSTFPICYTILVKRGKHYEDDEKWKRNGHVLQSAEWGNEPQSAQTRSQGSNRQEEAGEKKRLQKGGVLMFYCYSYETNEILAGPFNTSKEAREYGDKNLKNYYIM